jgi:uncharacterized repeat protein (TIGR03803 family)
VHSKQQFCKILCGALALATAVTFIVAMLVVPASAQNASQVAAHNNVPPTARQAAAMPEFASRLHPPHASRQSPASAFPHRQMPSPQDPVIYENGPANGTTDAWTINYGYVVSDTISTLTGGNVTGFDFYAWEFPGDSVTSVDWSITSSENAPCPSELCLGNGTARVTDRFISTNQFGYNIDHISASGLNVSASGTVWLNLYNAVVPSGDPVYWDENSGVGCQSQGCPSQASESSVGTIPSEAFDVVGIPCDHCSYPLECAHDKDGFKIIHDFTSSGQPPAPGLALDRAGRVYGNITSGGDNGLGLVYQLALHLQDWIITPILSFLGGVNGYHPQPELVGPDGVLYGIADGGIQNCGSSGDQYCGIVYRLRPSSVACFTALCSWTEEVIYRFTGNDDSPSGNLVFDRGGTLYGATGGGGLYGYGTIYKLTPTGGGWTKTTIYSFTGGYDGSYPGLSLLGHDGYLYGTSSAGLFRLTPLGENWPLKLLARAWCAQVQDGEGNFYCLSSSTCYQNSPFGIIYKLSSQDWTLSTVEDTFCPCENHYCSDLYHDLAVDPAGQVYVTEGGFAVDYRDNFYDFGNVHRVGDRHDPLVSFYGDVFDDLQTDANGKFYGTNAACGSSKGTVWQLTP